MLQSLVLNTIALEFLNSLMLVVVSCCWNILPSPALRHKKRALVISIQYQGQRWPDGEDLTLRGCHEDAKDIIRLLREREGYDERDICILDDKTSSAASRRPTQENILKAIKWLVDGCQSGDSRYFYFAGHGYQVVDQDGDEKDGMDEALMPCDWATEHGHSNEGLIIDDLLRQQLVDTLPSGATLTAVFDCCHSGTILDIDQETAPQNIGICTYKIASSIVGTKKRYASVKAKVICFSACSDGQLASELYQRGRFTVVFAGYMRKNSTCTYQALGRAIFNGVHGGYGTRHQDPQLWMSDTITSAQDFDIGKMMVVL